MSGTGIHVKGANGGRGLRDQIESLESWLSRPSSIDAIEQTRQYVAALDPRDEFVYTPYYEFVDRHPAQHIRIFHSLRLAVEMNAIYTIAAILDHAPAELTSLEEIVLIHGSRQNKYAVVAFALARENVRKDLHLVQRAFEEAAYDANIAVLELFLGVLSVNAETLQSSLDRALCTAGQGTRTENIVWLLNHGGDVQSRSNGALFSATLRGRKDNIRLLLRRGATIPRTQKGKNVFMHAVWYHAKHGDFLDIAQLYLDLGADINERDGAALSCVKTVEDATFLLDRGAKITQTVIDNCHVLEVRDFLRSRKAA